VLAADEGNAIWFANALMLLKATSADTEGRFALLDQRVPAEVTFYCWDESFTAGSGA
jgi:hypothetical protein